MSLMKRCSKCEATKSIADFCKDKQKSDGLQSYCRACNSARLKSYNSKPEIKARHKEYIASYFAKPENKVRQKKYLQQHFIKNRTKYRESIDRWRVSPENKDKIRAVGRNRRARERLATGSHSAADVRVLMVLQRGKCACCRTCIADEYHVDHIQPLALGGSNDKHNIQLLCPTCNMKKGAKPPLSWAAEHGRLL